MCASDSADPRRLKPREQTTQQLLPLKLLLLQRLTTREPDESMVEVAIASV